MNDWLCLTATEAAPSTLARAARKHTFRNTRGRCETDIRRHCQRFAIIWTAKMKLVEPIMPPPARQYHLDRSFYLSVSMQQRRINWLHALHHDDCHAAVAASWIHNRRATRIFIPLIRRRYGVSSLSVRSHITTDVDNHRQMTYGCSTTYAESQIIANTVRAGKKAKS